MDQNGSNSKIENSILKGEEDLYQLDYTSLGQFVLDTLEESPDFVGQVDAVTDEIYTYKKMRERSVRCALWMRSEGLRSGDLVTICSHNHLDISMPCFAALYLGAIPNPLDAVMNAKEICHMMNIVKPKMAFVSEESVAAVDQAAKQAKLDVKIIVFGRVADGLFPEFEGVIAERSFEEVKNFTCTPIENGDQTAFVMCSSGSTGLPKGVALSHGAILRQLIRSQIFGMNGESCLMFSSIHWISGMLCMFMTLFCKMKKIVTTPFEEYSSCETLDKYQARWLFLGSSMINRWLKSDALKRYNFSYVKRVCYGGAPLALATRQAFAKVVPNAEMLSGYGLTELSGIFSMQRSDSKPGSCGQMVENAQLKVIDPNTGRILGPNQTGELFLKTASMMSFYYGNPQATAEAIDEEGWLHSGDLGYYDEDGEIFVVDRMKELIKYRGYHISPVEIESVILSHPGVKEAAVVSIPHPVDDERPFAFVVRATDSSDVDRQITEKEIVDLVAAEMSAHKHLRGGIRFIDSIPKTPSDKTRRRELWELARSTARIGED